MGGTKIPDNSEDNFPYNFPFPNVCVCIFLFTGFTKFIPLHSILLSGKPYCSSDGDPVSYAEPGTTISVNCSVETPILKINLFGPLLCLMDPNMDLEMVLVWQITMVQMMMILQENGIEFKSTVIISMEQKGQQMPL